MWWRLWCWCWCGEGGRVGRVGWCGNGGVVVVMFYCKWDECFVMKVVV